MITKNLRYTVCALCACIALLVFTAMPANAQAVSTTVVISQYYGGGGNSGSTYKNDFVELRNISLSPASVTGWTVQYQSAAGTGTWQTTTLSGTIPAGGYYLVQEAAGTGGTTNLPTPDAIGTIAMSATTGKVALVSSTTALSGACPSTNVVDLVGFGTTTCFETAVAPAPSNTNAILRAGGGCSDTGSNAADFTTGAPNPRNSATIAVKCGSPEGTGSATPTILGMNTTLTVTVTPGKNPPSTGITVTGDLTAIGGAAETAFSNGGSGNVYTYTQLVPAEVGAGTKLVPISITDAEERSAAPFSISVSVNEPAKEYPIHDVQGGGDTSPFVEQRLAVSGIVTSLVYNGFYLEAPYEGWDTDPATSEGVFIYTGSAPTVAVGDGVQATGKVSEYQPSGSPLSTTEISDTPIVIVLTHSNTLPPVADITPDPNGAINQFEPYEGMLVRLGSPQVTGPTGASGSNSNGVFYVTSSTLPRPFREPGLEPGSAVLPGMPANVPHFDGNPERMKVDSSNCATRVTAGVGDHVPDLVGPLGYNGDFTIYACPDVTSTVAAVPLPARAANEFTVGSFNMLNFTSTNPDRIAKASLAIRTVMGSPDVIGVEEMADLATLQLLRDKLNQDLGGSTYEASLLATSGTQNVGFLYRTDRLSNVSVEQVGADVLMPNNQNVLNDRPPLVMKALVKPDSLGAGYPVTVIVNHLRSLIDVDTVGSTGDFARTKRQWGAEYLANLIAQHQAAGEKVISVGDYNAFEFNDGYVDVLGTITGNPAPSDQVLLASPDLVNPNAVDMAMTLPVTRRYSYVENGSAQTLDHIVVTPNLLGAPYHLEIAHNNADFPLSLSTDYSRPERVSDHDMPVAYFTLPPTADSVSPSGGTGDSTFTFTFSSRLGYETITTVQAGIGPQANYSGTCVVSYSPVSNRMYLNNDAGGWLGPVMPNSSGTLSNGQCTLNAAGSSVSGSGHQLSLSVALTFKTTFVGQQNMFGIALDAVSRSDWNMLGTWTPSVPTVVPQPIAPTADSVTPNGAVGTTQNLTFQFSSVNGNSYISWVQGIINSSSSYTGGCVFNYSRTTGKLSLMNDAGTTWLGSVAIGSVGTLSNSKCTIDTGASSVGGDGNALTVTLALTASSTWMDAQRIYGYVTDRGGLRSGWVQLGTWTPNVPVPTPPTVTSATAAAGNVTFTFSDVNGAGYINWAQVIIGNAQTYANGCAISFVQQSGRLTLMNDAGNAWLSGVTLGQFGTTSNTQCSINAKNSTATVNGNDLVLNLSLTAATAFKGQHYVWGYVVDGGNRNSGWVKIGTLTLQ